THAYILRLAVGAIDGLYGITGVTGIYSGNRIERAWRDIHAISHHISLNWDASSTMYGQHLLGLEPHGQY
ncbi:MAG TPA: acyl-CoA dehydrogenase, partial [Alphaproteobacteria bacterium]